MFKTGRNLTRQEVSATEVMRVKDAYHAKARSLSWEEKVASIERMREASKVARESMLRKLAGDVTGAAALVDPEVIKKTCLDGVLPEGAVTPPDLVEKVA